MHAILVGRKIYALDMPSNFIFTHRRWLTPSLHISDVVLRSKGKGKGNL